MARMIDSRMIIGLICRSRCCWGTMWRPKWRRPTWAISRRRSTRRPTNPFSKSRPANSSCSSTNRTRNCRTMMASVAWRSTFSRRAATTTACARIWTRTRTTASWEMRLTWSAAALHLESTRCHCRWSKVSEQSCSSSLRTRMWFS